MIILGLIRQLQALVAADGFRGEVAVTLGAEMGPVMGTSSPRPGGTSMMVLKLAPTKLERARGF